VFWSYPVEYQDYIQKMVAQDPALAEELANFYTLENVLRWREKRKIPLETFDVIFQDEYSHDFIIPLGPEGRSLVFGIT
jgi:hypothetical protein